MFVVILTSLIRCSYCISFELEMLSLNKSLEALDYNISSFIISPECTLRDTFLRWLSDYNHNLCQLVSLLNDEDVRAEPVALTLLRKNGPLFLNTTINVELLKDCLFWGDADVQEMYYCIGVTEVLWFELKNVLSPYGERHIRNINIPQDLYELDVRGRLREDVHFTKGDYPNDPKSVPQ